MTNKSFDLFSEMLAGLDEGYTLKRGNWLAECRENEAKGSKPSGWPPFAFEAFRILTEIKASNELFEAFQEWAEKCPFPAAKLWYVVWLRANKAKVLHHFGKPIRNPRLFVAEATL